MTTAMDLDLRGKRALVTGGSCGIGLQIARALIAEGADVAIAARDRQRLAAAETELSALTAEGIGGGRIVTAQVDTGDDASVRDAVAQLRDRLGGIDILVNNAAVPGGQGPRVPPSQVSDWQFTDALNIKVLGYLRTARAVIPGMIEQRWGASTSSSRAVRSRVTSCQPTPLPGFCERRRTSATGTCCRTSAIRFTGVCMRTQLAADDARFVRCSTSEAWGRR